MSTAPLKPRRSVVPSDHEHVDRISTRTTLVVLIVIAFIAFEIRWILLPFVVAGLLAYVCTPLIEWLTAHTRVPRSLFALAVFLALLLVGVAVGVLGVPPLVRELTHVQSEFQSIIRTLAKSFLGDRTVSLLGQRVNAVELAHGAVSGLRAWVGQVDKITVLGSVAFTASFGMVLTLVLLLYFLVSGPGLARGLLWLAPPKQRPLIRHIWSVLDPVLKRYFIGVIVVVAYATAAAYVGLKIALDMPHAVVLALLTGLLEMMPVIGPGLAAVIVGLVAIHYAKGMGSIVAYALYAAALRLSIDQFFGPIALGSAARMHPVLIIFSFLAGGVLFGIVGLIMAVPVALVIKVTLAILYDEALEAEQVEREVSR